MALAVAVLSLLFVLAEALRSRASWLESEVENPGTAAIFPVYAAKTMPPCLDSAFVGRPALRGD
jgi:hypothetical protein